MSEGAQSSSPAAPAVSPVTENQNPGQEDQDLDAELASLESEEASQESKVAPESKAPAKAADKAAKQEGAKKDGDKYKIKVDGEEVELSKEEMIRYAQMGRAGQKRMAEAAQVQKEAKELIDLLRSDPEAVLADPAILGSSEEVIKFAQKILARQLEEQEKSPEVREKEAAQKELEDLRKQLKDEQKRKDREDYDRLVQQEEQRLESEINSAIDESGLPPSPLILKRIADVLISSEEMVQKAKAQGREVKPISPKQAMSIVKKELMKDMKEFIGLSPDEALEELMGGDRIKSLRKKQLSKVKAAATETAAPSVNNQLKPVHRQDLNTESKSTEKKISMKDFLRGR